MYSVFLSSICYGFACFLIEVLVYGPQRFCFFSSSSFAAAVKVFASSAFAFVDVGAALVSKLSDGTIF